LELPVVESAPRVWYNPNQDETWFQSIAHILRMITLFAFLLPAAALVREKEHGTVEQLLVAPVTPLHIMLSKVLAMTVVVLASTMFAVTVIMKPLFGVPIRGSLTLYHHRRPWPICRHGGEEPGTDRNDGVAGDLAHVSVVRYHHPL
jgi:ABC-2 type transport system permease protein